MMGLKTIGAGIKDRLATIASLNHVYAPDELPGAINEFPCVLIMPGETTYRVTFGGESDYLFRIIVLLTSQDQPSALSNILDYLEESGTDSIKAAIEGDPTLGGVADDSTITRNLGLGATTWAGHTYLSTEFELKVLGG